MLSDALSQTSPMQGSVCDPILLREYIDDILQNVPNGCYLACADDMVLIVSGKLLQEVSLLQSLLYKVFARVKKTSVLQLF